MSVSRTRTAPGTPKPKTARSELLSHTLARVRESSLLDRCIAAARDALVDAQHEHGYWLFELEADCTIPAEYILMMHFLDEIDAPLVAKIAVYLRAHQAEHGGWPLYHNGDFDLSCSVKAYFALKLAGDDPDAAHMRRARAAILQRGGAARANVFTRIALALFGQLPWRGVPYIPVEIMLLPRWFPFHIDRVSYWSRTVMVPLLILCTRKPIAKNPRNINIRELFTTPPEEERDYFRGSRRQPGFLAKLLLVVSSSSAYCQPCVSPVWDSALAGLAMQEAGCAVSVDASVRALDWLKSQQLLDDPGDWRIRRPELAGGGWAFQFANSYYPDLDDTAVVAWAMHQSRDSERYTETVNRALDWLVGMQSSNGGFAAFDADNTYYYLNEIPFADHGALLDPPTSDVSARVVAALARIARPQDKAALDRAIVYLRSEQMADGSWFGRWGTNYIYGTWSVLTAFAQAGISATDPAVRKAVSWLTARQNEDGAWGESNATYSQQSYVVADKSPNTPYQTAWALLALLAAGAVSYTHLTLPTIYS